MNIAGFRNRWLVGAVMLVVVVIAAVGVVVLLRVTRGGDGPGRAPVPAGEQVPGLVGYQDLAQRVVAPGASIYSG